MLTATDVRNLISRDAVNHLFRTDKAKAEALPTRRARFRPAHPALSVDIGFGALRNVAMLPRQRLRR